MDLGIKNRTALVCAASSGIGLAIARSLAHEGLNIAICARNEEKLKQAQSQLQGETNSQVIAVTADLSLLSDIHRLIKTVNSKLGSIDILINNV